MVGQKFGKLVVIEEAAPGKGGAKNWLCQCECGNTVIAGEKALLHGGINSCGCTYLGPDLIGQKYGMLTVLGRDTFSPSGTMRWLCKCECGVIVTRRTDSLKSKPGDIPPNCGCITNKAKTQWLHSHDMSRTKVYHVWVAMKQRCNNPNIKSYKNYGGRGITVCDRWTESFENFWEDMGPTYHEGLQLDRIDNDGPYSPENCHWVSAARNGRNKRNNKAVDSLYGEMTIADLADESGVSAKKIGNRIKEGLPDELLTTKVKPTNIRTIADVCDGEEGVWLTDKESQQINQIFDDIEKQLIEEIPHG